MNSARSAWLRAHPPRGGERRARNVLGAGAFVLIGGCLDEAPEFAPRNQIPPFVVAGEVEPPISAIYDGPIPFSMNVPFRSEDVNAELQWRLYLDLVPGTSRPDLIDLIDTDVVPASTYDDDTRSVSLEWTQPMSPGCHSITMILTYSSNFNPLSRAPSDESLAAMVVWWVSVDDPEEEVGIDSCLSLSQIDGF